MVVLLKLSIEKIEIKCVLTLVYNWKTKDLKFKEEFKNTLSVKLLLIVRFLKLSRIRNYLKHIQILG